MVRCLHSLYRAFQQHIWEKPKPETEIFLQVGDPSQNSKKTKVALDNIGAEIFSIPWPSTNMNPTENIFNIKEMLHAEALSKNITKENFEEFLKSVKDTLHSIPLETINKTIGSVPSHLEMIVKGI